MGGAIAVMGGVVRRGSLIEKMALEQRPGRD